METPTEEEARARREPNRRYWRDDALMVHSEAVASERLDALRAEAKDKERAFRSCWRCNPAHAYFLDGDWGDAVIWCFACGAFLYQQTDITIWDDDTKETEHG